MTIIFSEDFEGGSPGAPVTTSNTALDGVDGEPTFTDEYVVEGNLGFLTDGSSGLSRGALAHPPAAAHIQAFIYFVTVPSTNTPIIVWYQGRPGAGISQVGDLQYRTGGQLAIRDGYTAVWQSTAQFTAGSWVRVQILCDAGQEHRLRLFYGANLMGTVPDEDSGPLPAGGTAPIEYARFGVNTSNTGAQYAIDAVTVGDTGWAPPPAQPEEPYAHLLTGSGWVDLARPTLITL